MSGVGKVPGRPLTPPPITILKAKTSSLSSTGITPRVLSPNVSKLYRASFLGMPYNLLIAIAASTMRLQVAWTHNSCECKVIEKPFHNELLQLLL
jgi:hypothetical protein